VIVYSGTVGCGPVVVVIVVVVVNKIKYEIRGETCLISVIDGWSILKATVGDVVVCNYVVVAVGVVVHVQIVPPQY